MKYAVICAGGPATEIIDLLKYQKEDTVFIGADRGAISLLNMGITPSEAVGDFDSISKSEYERLLSKIDIVDQFQAEKDETDTELAMERAVKYHPEKIILTGVTGGRLDHMESALHLMYRFQLKYPTIVFTICNPKNEMTLLSPGDYQLTRDDRLPYISFFSFGGSVEGLTLVGFKYEMTQADLEIGMTKFTSNELAKGVCTISFRKGICLMVRSADA